MVAVDVKELAAGAVEAAEGRLVGIDRGAARSQEGSRCTDVGRRGGESKRRIRSIQEGSGKSTGRRKPHPAR